MTTDSVVAADCQASTVPLDGQVWAVSWHPPPAPPEGAPHGAECVCVADQDQVVVISPNGERWGFPAGRPEGSESGEETLHREVLEEAGATVVRTRLLGFSRGVCTAGRQQGVTLVRSIWRADVRLDAWEPWFEMAHRQVVAATGPVLRVWFVEISWRRRCRAPR